MGKGANSHGQGSRSQHGTKSRVITQNETLIIHVKYIYGRIRQLTEVSVHVCVYK